MALCIHWQLPSGETTPIRQNVQRAIEHPIHVLVRRFQRDHLEVWRLLEGVRLGQC